MSLICMAHFVQLVPFGQLGENFWGGSCSEISACQNSKFYCEYLSKFYWIVIEKVTCTHVMCDDVSVNVCSVYSNIINIFLLTCFVWGISNQYYMVITLIFDNFILV